MSQTREDVKEFHKAFNLPIRKIPYAAIDKSQKELRIALLEEEVEEFICASNYNDIIEVADALADIVYVAYGTALVYGIDLDAVLREVHRSNMTKLGPNGKPEIRADGKILKGVGFSPPNIFDVLLKSVVDE